MTSPNNKIMITEEEVAEARPRRTATLGAGAPTVPGGQSHPRAAAVSWLWLILVTPIPFVNSWMWYRMSHRVAGNRRPVVALAVLLGLVSVLAAVGAGAYVLSPRPSWVQRIYDRADGGVVQVLTAQGMGTGFVIASQGHRRLILTNRHVLQEDEGIIFTRTVIPNEVQCRLRSGQTVAGRVCGLPIEDQIDLALVLAESDELAPMGKIGSFEGVAVGEEVVAIGHPINLDWTITKGIISGLREGLWLQTDVAINPGNSGGPLIDKRGRIVGVNTMSLRGTADSDSIELQGLNFAMRADIVLRQDKWAYTVPIDDLLASLR